MKNAAHKYKEVTFYIRNEDFAVFRATENKILELSSKNELIDPKLAQHYFNMMYTSSEALEMEAIASKVNNLVEKASIYFRNCRGGYNFSGKSGKKEFFTYKDSDKITNKEAQKALKQKFYEYYDLDDLFTTVLSQYFLYDLKHSFKTKNDHFIFLHKSLTAYRDSKFTKQDQTKCKPYKLVVFSAYLFRLLGFQVSIKGESSNNKLFHATKQIVKSDKNKKK